MNPSLRAGLLAWLIPAMLVALGMSAAGAYWIGARSASIAYDEALKAAAEDVALNVRWADGALRLELSPQAERIVRADGQDRIAFAVSDARGAVIAGDRDLPEAPLVSRQGGASAALRFRGEPVQALRMRFDAAGEPFTVTVAETPGKRRAMARSVLLSLLVPEALVLALAVLFVWLSVGRGLRPLHALQAQLEVRGDRAAEPLTVADAPREVHTLVAALNHTIERLHRASRLQQDFVADTAHQLRTPLARIQAQLDQWPALDGAAQARAVTQLRDSTARAVRLANQLLALGRAERDAAASARQPVDWVRLVGRCADDWVHRAMEQSIDLGFELQPAVVRGDEALLRELVENLVDNALRYAGRGQVVTVSTQTERGEAVLRVDDSGPGIAAESRERALQRYVRLGPDDGSGSGLGLAIVDAIARQHGGGVRIDDSPLGGARISVRLPAA